MRQFLYKNYSHHIGMSFYEEVIKIDVPAENLKDKLDSASFLLSEYYPIVINPSKMAVYYNTFNTSKSGHTLKESFFTEHDKEIRNAFDIGCEYMIYVDEELVGNDKYIYSSPWCSQPISMDRSANNYLYVLAAFQFKGRVVYYIFPLRTKAGADFLEVYHGSYLSKTAKFAEFGLGIYTNLVKLTYASPYVRTSTMREHFTTSLPEEMRSYRIKQSMETLGGDK